MHICDQVDPLANSKVLVVDQSHVGEARRRAVATSIELDFADADVERISIAASELASNLAKHSGKGGQMFFLPQRGGHTLDLISIDSGRGMDDVDICMADGFSTSRSLGTGLGAVRRFANEFDLYSQPGVGTVIFARFYRGKTVSPETKGWDIAGIRQSKEGESVCGDNWSFNVDDQTITSMVVDGLGHGIDAAEAANAAVHTFNKLSDLAPVELLRRLHIALSGSRGAVGAVARIDAEKLSLTACGAGNINVIVAAPGTSKYVLSHNGTLGYEVHRFEQLTYAWTNQSCLIMHSDGISGRWNLSNYPNILQKKAGIIAAVLFRDFNKGTDDSTISVVKREFKIGKR